MPRLRTSLWIVIGAAVVLAGGLGKADDAALLKIHIISGSKSYKSEPSLRVFQKHLEDGYRVTCTASWGRDGCASLENLDQLPSAELMIVFARRMKLGEKQMAIIRKHWEQGKPIIGIRTASHAFQKADNAIFDRKVLGGRYGSYTGKEFEVANSSEQKNHPILRDVGPITSRTMYTSGKLAPATVVLQVGTRDQPVTWVHSYKGGRVFYTSLGVPEDFKKENFRQLLTNAVFWTTKRDPSKMIKK